MGVTGLLYYVDCRLSVIGCRLSVVGVTYKPSDDSCRGHETMVMIAKVNLRLVGLNGLR